MVIKNFIKILGAVKGSSPTPPTPPTPTEYEYVFTGFPSITDADYSSYNGTYTETAQVVNGEPVFQNQNGNVLYLAQWTAQTGEGPIVGYWWIVYSNTSLATGYEPSDLANMVLAQGSLPTTTANWTMGENALLNYRNAYYEEHGVEPPDPVIVCTRQSS